MADSRPLWLIATGTSAHATCEEKVEYPCSAVSWRWALAERLADVVGATLELLPDRVGASLRFQ